MAFRARLKKTFSRSSSTSNGSSDKSSSSSNSPQHHKTGEPFPLKYRRPVDTAHRERLEAFSFSRAWRRVSHQSQVSPMGSRLPSRQGSVVKGPSEAASGGGKGVDDQGVPKSNTAHAEHGAASKSDGKSTSPA